LELFPDIGLEKEKFRRKWKDPAKRRLFFENFAREHAVDPLKAETWYSKSLLKSLIAKKGTHGVLQYHERNVSKALVSLFPNIGLDRSRIIAGRPAAVKINPKVTATHSANFFEDTALPPNVSC